MTAVVARSLADLSPAVTVQQLRVLVMLSTRGEINLAAAASGLGISRSNASRVCDRLVASDLVARAEDPSDRRHVLLTLSPRGRDIVDSLMHRRLTLFEDLVDAMSDADRRILVSGLEAFLAAIQRPGGSDPDGDGPLAEVLPWLL
jgi:DNA-binding MarR family transcriptional regulator